jgi:hypothetical protein
MSAPNPCSQMSREFGVPWELSAAGGVGGWRSDTGAVPVKYARCSPIHEPTSWPVVTYPIRDGGIVKDDSWGRIALGSIAVLIRPIRRGSFDDGRRAKRT